MKASVLVLCLLILAGTVAAQSTTVSGQISDSGSQSWNNGTYSFVFKPAASNPTGNYFWNGSPFNVNTTIAGNLSGSGTFSVSVPSSTSITPSGSSWAVTVCPAATATNGCFSVALTISGPTQSITSQVVPPPIVVNLINPPAGASAYTDGETTGAKTGSFYFNLSDSTIHVCTGFPPCTWVSIGSTSSILPSNNTFTGMNTFTQIITAEALTVTGATTMGTLTVTTVDGIVFTTSSLAAAISAISSGGHIYVNAGSYTTTGFTLGKVPCANEYAQVMEMNPVAYINTTGTITLLCGGYIRGTQDNRDGSTITAVAGFPSTTPLVTIGDNVHLVDAKIEGVAINCALFTGCTGIQAYGLNENSSISHTLIENYLTNGIYIDGTTVNTADFKIEDNQLAAGTGASDGIYVKNAQTLLLSRNTIVSNGSQITAAGLHFASTNSSMGPSTVVNVHCEKYTDCMELDGTDNVNYIGIDAQNGTQSAIHITASATGNAFGQELHNNGNTTCVSATFLGCVVRNDVTTTYLASTNPPSPSGIIPSYQWQASAIEIWTDLYGIHLGNIAFANLGTPSNGVEVYCNNCTIANPCNSGGTGAIAKRLNGVWVCN